MATKKKKKRGPTKPRDGAGTMDLFAYALEHGHPNRQAQRFFKRTRLRRP